MKTSILVNMLNCTDLACVLHHHNFYAHLHHLKHHLQDENFNADRSEDSTNLDDNDNVNTNDTGSDLSSLSHIGAPNDVIYMVCGVVIAMLFVGLIIILVAITINKLRKREETSTDTQTPPEAAQSVSINQQFFGNSNNSCDRQLQISAAITDDTQTEPIIYTLSNGSTCNDVVESQTANNWIFPPKAPTPNIYNYLNTDALMTSNNKNGFRGFRKQFSGRFKRLVTKKNESSTAIPPELKPQLKTIYVY